MSGSANNFLDYQYVLQRVDKLLVNELKAVLKEVNLQATGLKQLLRDRITARLNHLKATSDEQGYQKLRYAIYNGQVPGPNHIPRPNFAQNNRPQMSNQQRPAEAMENGRPGHTVSQFSRNSKASAPQPKLSLNFKMSPFYDILEHCSAVACCPSSTRNTVTVTFAISPTAVSMVKRGPQYAIAVFSTETSLPVLRPNLLEFPLPAELQVNSKKVTANIRGMKNKPGTVPPADITNLLTLAHNVQNKLEITYQTNHAKMYAMQVNLIRKHTVEELVGQIRTGKFLSKESVIEQLRVHDDDDIIATSTDLTLKDPLSYTRIGLPCRSIYCKHSQCFDATAFLQVNEQTPTWTCPICYISIDGLRSLAVDGYFQDILERAGADVETVIVEPSGTWRLPPEERFLNGRQTPKRGTGTPDTRAQDQVLDLSDDDNNANNNKERKSQTLLSRLPSCQNTATKKRILPTVIDLTEDSDEDESLPLAKRQKAEEKSPNAPKITLNLPKPSSLFAAGNGENNVFDAVPSATQVGYSPFSPLYNTVPRTPFAGFVTPNPTRQSTEDTFHTPQLTPQEASNITPFPIVQPLPIAPYSCDNGNHDHLSTEFEPPRIEMLQEGDRLESNTLPPLHYPAIHQKPPSNGTTQPQEGLAAVVNPSNPSMPLPLFPAENQGGADLQHRSAMLMPSTTPSTLPPSEIHPVRTESEEGADRSGHYGYPPPFSSPSYAREEASFPFNGAYDGLDDDLDDWRDEEDSELGYFF